MPDFQVSTGFSAQDKGVKTFFRSSGREATKFGRVTTRAFKSASRSGTGFGTVLKGVLGANVISRGTALLATGIRSTITEFIEFDSAVTRASAKFKGLDLTTKEGIKTLGELRATARDVGATTEFTATQAGQGLNFLAMAGINAKNSMALLPGVVDLATTAELDLGRSTDIATDSLGAFNLMSEDNVKLTKNMARVNDVFSKTTTTANTTLEQLFEAVQSGGSTFTATGQELETFTSLVGVMASKGVKGEKAGTALRNVMLRLANATPEASKVMRRLGIKVADSEGNFRDIVDILADFEKGLKDVGEVASAKALDIVFGKKAITPVTTLFAEGTESIRTYREEIIKAKGASKSMADIIRTSLGNKIKTLGSAALDLGFKFIRAFDKDAKGGIESLTQSIRDFDAKPIVDGIIQVFSVVKKLVPIIGELTIVWATFKAVTLATSFVSFIAGLGGVSVAMGVLGAVIAANPIGAIIVGVGLAIVALRALRDNWGSVVEFFEPGIKKITGLMDSFSEWLSGKVEGITSTLFGISDFFNSINPFGDEATAPESKRTAPNESQIALQRVQFQGRIDINGAPEGSTAQGSTSGGAPGIEMALGVNP